MKIKFSVLVFMVSMFTLSGQSPFPNKNEITQFMASKTCVVLEADAFSFYNAYIKRAVEAYWNITPYEFIDMDEFSVRQNDSTYSFIMLTQTNYEKDKANTEFNFLNLLQGKKVDELREMPEICAIPLSFADEEDTEYGYKFGAILRFMQNHARMIFENPLLTGRQYLKYYNANIPKIKQKTLLIKKEDLASELSTLEKIKTIYPHKVEIVSEEDIAKAITAKTPNTLILHKVGPMENKTAGLCFKMLIGVDDADMYYYHEHKLSKVNSNNLLPSDLKRMSK